MTHEAMSVSGAETAMAAAAPMARTCERRRRRSHRPDTHIVAPKAAASIHRAHSAGSAPETRPAKARRSGNKGGWTRCRPPPPAMKSSARTR